MEEGFEVMDWYGFDSFCMQHSMYDGVVVVVLVMHHVELFFQLQILYSNFGIFCY